ncbi:MAG: diaminopimelate decarboxylase [Chloroflexota bacterium]|nr:diaminopimelate decarboxylase [Chloroflexota bacterium]
MPNAASLDALPYRHVLPHTTALSPAGGLSIGGCDLRELAETYGSPLYAFDEQDFRETAREFRREFESRWPEVSVLYAAKAYLSLPLADIVAEEGLGMDVVSGGELAIARAAGFPSSRLYFHGNNKSAEELDAAVAADPVGRIVVDNFHELAELDRIAGERGAPQPILLRVSPNVDPHTHAKTTTGVLDSKFGFAIANGDAERAVAAAMAAPNIDLRGLHVHLGSPIFEIEPYEQASDVMCAFAAQMGDTHGFSFDEYSPGGGFALAYTREQHAPAIAEYAERVANSMERALAEHRLEQPSLHIEPGRSLIGRAMVAVYTVGARKEIPGVRTYVSVDGGMADNIRPAMYGSGYEAVPVDRPLDEPTETVTVAGKYCESGDILVRDAELPRLEAGELVALPASGGYNLAMSSNYNMALRPPVVAVRDGESRLLQRRETVEDLVARDVR